MYNVYHWYKITKTQNLYFKKSSEMHSANGNTTLNRN